MKTLTLLAVLPLILSFQVASAHSKLPQGRSIGEAESLDSVLFSQDTGLDFETDEDSTPNRESLTKWSDKKIERHFRDEVDNVNYWLDQLAASEDGVSRFQKDVEAAQRSARPGRTKMSGLTCLAIAIQGEAGGEPAAGKAAVAETILTRAGGNPARICSVVFAHAQFEAMTKRARQPSAETMRVAQAAIKNPKSCGFDHFINKRLQLSLGRKIPSWVISYQKRGCRHAKIGQQDYYSSCSCKG